jgi:NAD-dependent protein deacetylase/lipoamidase
MASEHLLLQRIAVWLAEAESAVAITGAGISTESGIADFRSPGGVWSKYQTVYFDDFLANADARNEYWRQKVEGHREFADARPNDGHEMLAKWEQSGLLRGVITQNIDGLHTLAGSSRVLELHGTARQVTCLDCQLRRAVEPFIQQFLAEQKAPPCPECGGRLKHATVSFGQSLPADILGEASRWASNADLILAIGSSLVVSPACDLPRVAKQAGARLAIINRDETPLDSLADALVRTPIGTALRRIDALMDGNSMGPDRGSLS